jgi:hypothetical protein
VRGLLTVRRQTGVEGGRRGAYAAGGLAPSSPLGPRPEAGFSVDDYGAGLGKSLQPRHQIGGLADHSLVVRGTLTE